MKNVLEKVLTDKISSNPVLRSGGRYRDSLQNVKCILVHRISKVEEGRDGGELKSRALKEDCIKYCKLKTAFAFCYS